MSFPESGSEKQEDGEDFQTSDEHQPGTDPFGRIRKCAPRVGWTAVADPRTDIAQAGDGYTQRFLETDTEQHQGQPAEEDDAEIEENEGQNGRLGRG